MAYSSVRVQFEIGHEASVRTKKTPEGFTHDWEVFVRGADNTDIQCFVEKVVFHLHETFPKPRRVIKEPPYSVKESGYAGFVLPIDVYLKNKEEPKKISFHYDLNLQSSGPPISRVLREPRLFQNPSEDFRRKLIRGGGVGVDTPSEVQMEDLKSVPPLIQNKAKLTESTGKKHKPDQGLNHSFAELFGPPIRRVPEPKKLPEPPKKLLDDLSKEKKKTNKHGSYKEEKEMPKEKDKFLEKERIRDRDKSKEKTSKKVPSPTVVTAIQLKPKEEYKKYEEKEKRKEEYDDKRKRKDEKDKRDKAKDAKELDRQFEKEHKKDKKEFKDGDYLKKLNSGKVYDGRANFEKQNSEVMEKEKERLEKEKHRHRHKKKEKEKNRDKEKHRKEKEKNDKDSRERDREKEKSSRKKYDDVREKEEKRRKSRSPSVVQERMKKGPLNALLDELGSSDSASPLSEDESISPVKSLSSHQKPPVKIVPEVKPQPMLSVTPKFKSTNPNAVTETRQEKELERPPKFDESGAMKNKKEKSVSKKNKKSEKDAERKRGKEEQRDVRGASSEREREDEEREGREKVNRDEKEKERLEDEKPKSKDKETRKRKRERSEEKHFKSKKENTSTLQTGGPVELSDAAEESRRSDKFTKEYVAQLKDLQHRIMTLEDNAELQKVVKVIAETGQYEITKKTFDFDLCALDFETVKRLQEFFAPT